MLILSVISAKVRENPPSLKLVSFATKLEKPAWTIVSLCLCWTHLYRLGSRFLAGPSRTRMEKRPVFLCLDGQFLTSRLFN